MAARIGLRYTANIQFRRDARGTPVLLEVNARFPGTMPLTVHSGVNMPLMSLRDVLGEPPPEGPLPFRDVAVVRYWTEAFIEPGDSTRCAAEIARRYDAAVDRRASRQRYGSHRDPPTDAIVLRLKREPDRRPHHADRRHRRAWRLSSYAVDAGRVAERVDANAGSHCDSLRARRPAPCRGRSRFAATCRAVSTAPRASRGVATYRSGIGRSGSLASDEATRSPVSTRSTRSRRARATLTAHLSGDWSRPPKRRR